MKIVTSVSGGKTSAYIAANYKSDELVFALVRIEDQNCRFKDDKIRAIVEDKIQAPFIATAEDDLIIYTILDLEQHLGRNINWVTGITFDEVVSKKGGILPNKLHRYCTSNLKIDPIFQWWKKNIYEPIYMQIGYRANEKERANRMLQKCNKDGFLEYKNIISKMSSGRNKWGFTAWQKPIFPLIEDAIYKDNINSYWHKKPVRFANYNNCVGCFHRNAPFLRFMYQEHPDKMHWFEKQEGDKKGYWKDENGEVQPYSRIKKMLPQMTLFHSDFTSCDAGYCGM